MAKSALEKWKEENRQNKPVASSGTNKLEQWKQENRQNKPVTAPALSTTAAPATRGPSATSVYSSANRTAPMGMETRNTLMAAATEIAARQAEEQRRKKQQEAFMSNPRASTAYTRQTEKAPVQDRAQKVAEIRKDIDTTPVQGRVGKGLQSIGLSTPASIEYLGESAKQAYKNQKAYEESDLQQRIAEAYSNLNLTERQYGWGSPEYEQARQNYDAVVAQLNAFKNAPDKAVDMDSRAAQFMGGVQKLQEEALEGTSGAGRFLGEAALSIGSNLAKLPANAIIPGASLALMGAEAAAGKAYELGQRGVNAGQALTRGLVSGGIEALTEKIPLDNLVDIIKTGGKTGLMNVLKQVVTEAGEEGVAYLLNLGADKVAGDPEAEFVWNDFIRSMGLGALSGGIMGGGATAINRANAAAVGKNYQEVAPELIEEGLQMNRDTDAYRTAAEMQRKLDAGKTLSNVDVGRVVQDNETTMAPLRQAAMEMAEEQVEREAQAEMPKRTVVQPIAMKPRMAYTETRQNTEGGVNGGEEVHLRESGQRDDRAYPGGEVPRMEESAGAADTRGRGEGSRVEEAARPGQVTADIEGGTVYADQVHQSPFEQRPVDPGSRQQGGVYQANAGVSQGSSFGTNNAGRYYQIGPRDSGLASRKVTTTAGLGIANGASNDRVYIVTDGETNDTRAAKDLARSNGLRVVLFGGGNLNIDGAECRAYISGDRVFVRVDHDQFTAEQLMKHEVAHNKMDRGEIKRDVALANTKRKLRERNVDIDKVCRAYLTALNGAKLSVDQILEEIICDSEAGMNIFEDTPFESAYRTNVMENAKLDIESQMASAIENVADSEANVETQDPGDNPVVHASYESLANAAGFAAVQNENGTRNYVRDGKVVQSVTVADIDRSLIGKMIDYSVKDAEQQKTQKELFAGICTLAANTNDFSMSMTFAGSSVFTAMKANSDKQYGTTYDFPSICTKTQAVIDAMSAKMVREGRGLSKPEIEDLYQKVFAKGNPVPCPECYVFSRWVGIGGLLDNIKAYQDKYGNMDPAAVAKEYRAMESQIAEYALANNVEFGKAKGAMAAKTTKRYNELAEKISKARNQGHPVKESDVRQLEHLENMMTTAKALTWIKDVYFTDSSMKTRRKTFAVPDEVLFDLNQGETFARDYKAAWAFRTTQGAGYGKAITPYAEARLGEGILVTNNTPSTIKKKAAGKLDFKFLGEDGELTKDAKKAIDKAIVKQKTQAFLGGQRWQSTSDSRFENATDYLLAALELQTMKGMGQAYTKVDGAVAALSAWGISANQSLMPLGGGLDANGNLQDTAVGGMSRDVAFANRKKHETAGTITIGVNDNHIRALIREEGRDFVIPYHASGGDQELISAFRRTQDPDAADAASVRSTDYSRTQGDKILSDDVLRWLGKTDAEIEQIHVRRKTRLDILSGGTPDMTVVRNSAFLSNLYDKFNGGEWSGVKVAKGKVERQIFPNEFWDKTMTYDQSAKITEDYLAYCEELGFLHRFSGKVPQNGVLKPVTGYDQNGKKVQLTDLAYKVDENGQNTDEVEPFFWKTITDRRMYGNDGRYLEQKIVTLSDTKQETITGFARKNVGRQYNKAKSDELVEEIKQGKASRETNREDVLKAVENLLAEAEAKLDEQELADQMYYGRKAEVQKRNAQEKLERLREQKNERIAQVKAEGREAVKVARVEERAKADAKLAEQKQRSKDMLDELRSHKNERIAQVRAEGREAVKAARIEERVKRDEKLAKQKQRSKDMLDELRGQKNERIAQVQTELKQQAADRQAKMSERGKAAKMRSKITRHVNKMQQMLLHPSDKRHVPEHLRKATASVLSAINMESGYELSFGTDAKYHRVAPGTDPHAEKTAKTKAFEALRDAYNAIVQNKEEDSIIIDPELLGDSANGVKGLFDQFVELGKKPIADMNSTELEVVWKVLRSVEHSIVNAGKMLSKSKYETTKAFADAFASDAAMRRDMNRVFGNKISLDFEDPYTFFSHYGESGKAIYRILRNAQDEVSVKVDVIAQKMQEIVDTETVDAIQKERHEFTTEAGDKLTLTTGQLMSIYNLMHRQQAHDHLMKGGIVQPEIKRNGKQPRIDRGTEMVPLSANDLQELAKMLTDEQKKIASELQKMMTGELATWGNEASMAVYGYEKFTGEDYWPIKSAGEGLNTTIEKNSGAARSIKNIGMAKNTVPHANNALEIGDVFDVFAQHTADMVDYSSWLLPMEDLTRLYNWKYKDEKGNKTGKTIKGIMEQKGGKGSQKYLEELLKDIQNGIAHQMDTQTELWINRMIGNAKGASVGANIRVVVQQPTAFLRAAAIFDADSLAKGIAKGVTEGDGWEKAKKYAPIAHIKDVGGFDQGNARTISQQIYGTATKLEAMNEKLSWAAAKADAITWGKLWNAAEWETKKRFPKLEAGSDAFYEKAKELFTDMVDQSQVVDGVLQRTQIMRSGNAINKQASSFMGEPMKTMNMMVRAWDDWRHTDGAERTKNRKKMGRTAIALGVTAATNALMQALVDAIRDDDREKDYLDRVWTAFVGLEGNEASFKDKAKNVLLRGNLADNINPIGMYPYASDVLSVMQGYDVTRADADVIADVITNATALFKSASGEGKRTTIYNAKKLVTAIGKMFGVSAVNLGRDIWSAASTIVRSVEDYRMMYLMDRLLYSVDQNKKQFVKILYDAENAGETEQATFIRNSLLKNGVTEEDITKYAKAFRKDKEVAIRQEESFVSARTKASENIMEAVQKSKAYQSANEAQKLKAKLFADSIADYRTMVEQSGEMLYTPSGDVAKAENAEAVGVTDAQYILYKLALEMADANGNGKITQEEFLSADFELTKNQLAFMWVEDRGWKATTNPYD